MMQATQRDFWLAFDLITLLKDAVNQPEFFLTHKEELELLAFHINTTAQSLDPNSPENQEANNVDPAT